MSDSRNEVNTKGNPNFVATEAAEQGIKALIDTRKKQCQENDQGYNTENGACCDCEIEELECKNDKCSNGCKEEKGICEMPINLITQKKENKKKETTEKIQVLKKELENLEQNKTDYETQLREQKNKLNKLNESQNTDNIIIVNGTIRGTNALIKDAREKINKITNEINVLTTELEKYQSGGKKKRGKSRKKRKTKRRRKNTRKSRRKRKTKRRRKNTRKSRRKRKTKRRRKRKTKRRRRRRR